MYTVRKFDCILHCRGECNHSKRQAERIHLRSSVRERRKWLMFDAVRYGKQPNDGAELDPYLLAARGEEWTKLTGKG